MEIAKGVGIKDLGLLIDRSLVIADVHMGYEEALNKEGVLVPRFQYGETVKRLEKIMKNLEIDEAIINGDLKHEFGTISDTEWRNTLDLIDFLLRYCKKVVLLRGNHDTILGPIARKRNLEVKKYHVVKENYICHGDKIPKDLNFHRCKNIIIGHEHPAVGLREGARKEIYKCFLKGKYKKKNLIVMPSFNLMAEGTDVLREETLSPFLEQDLSEFEVFVVGERVMRFGKIKNILDNRKVF